jgi:hypothetical protein
MAPSTFTRPSFLNPTPTAVEALSVYLNARIIPTITGALIIRYIAVR